MLEGPEDSGYGNIGRALCRKLNLELYRDCLRAWSAPMSDPQSGRPFTGNYNLDLTISLLDPLQSLSQFRKGPLSC